MPLDPNIITYGLRQMPGVDINAMVQQQITGMENINELERQRQADALAMKDRERKLSSENEAAAVKALLPAYTYGIQTGDIVGAGNLAPPEMRGQLQPFIDALTGKSPQEVQAALIGSLASSGEVGQEALAAIQRAQTYGVQARQAKTAEDRLALDAERQAAELAAGNKVASREVDAQGNVHFFDAYGNEIRVAQGAGKPAASPAATDGVKLGPDQRMRADGTVEIIPGSQTYRKQKSVQSTDYNAATNALRELDKVRGVVSELKDTTGYQKAMGTGAIMSNLPNTPASSITGAYDFQTKYKNLKGSVATLGRAAASLQGKLGNMAVQEWKLVSDAIANLDLESMDADVLDAQLDIIANDIMNLEAQVRDAYEKEWGDTQFYIPLEERGPAGAAEGTGDDPLGIR